MIVFLNGHWLAEDQASLGLNERGFLYGDGLFETVRVSRGRPFRLNAHLERLRQSAEFFRIRLAVDVMQLDRLTHELIQRNELHEAVVRINLSRGPGPRGFSPRGADSPTLAITAHPLPVWGPNADPPPAWKLVTSRYRVLCNDPLGAHKTSSKLTHVMARMEAEDQGADEALLVNNLGEATEATSANLFWVEQGCVYTMPVNRGVLPGITRSVVIEICRRIDVGVREESIAAHDLWRADGLFLTQSVLGVIPASALDGKALPRPPVVEWIRDAYREILDMGDESSG